MTPMFWIGWLSGACVAAVIETVAVAVGLRLSDRRHRTRADPPPPRSITDLWDEMREDIMFGEGVPIRESSQFTDDEIDAWEARDHNRGVG